MCTFKVWFIVGTLRFLRSNIEDAVDGVGTSNLVEALAEAKA